MLLCTFVYKFLDAHRFISPHPAIYVRVELLGHSSLAFLVLSDCFPKQPHYFASPPAVWEGSDVSVFWSTLTIIF